MKLHKMKVRGEAILAALCVLTSAAFSAYAAEPVVGTPDSYIDYAESTGSQYIDTGIVGRYGTKVEVRFTGWSDVGSALFGAVGNNNNHYLPYRNRNNELRFIFGLSGNDGDKSTEAGANAINIYHQTVFDVTDDGTVNVTYDNANAVTSSSGSGQLTTGINIWLFAANSRGSAGWGSKARLFGCRIWQDGKLVRDFHPCMKDDKIALYDEIEGKIYFPGGGNLIAPNDNPVFLDYVQATGSQHINTGVEGRYGTTVEAQFSDWTSDGKALFGAVGEVDNKKMHYQAMRYSSNLRFIYSEASSSAVIKKESDTYTEIDYTAKRTLKTEVTNDGAINVYVDGVVKTEKAALGKFTTELDMYVFAGNNCGVRSWPASVKLHGMKIWQDGILVRNFLPCRKNSLVGLYDVENELFYPSLGALVAGTDKTLCKFVEYVASSGTQCIDTGVVGRYGTAVEAHFSDMTKNNTALFGSKNSDGIHFLGMSDYYGKNLRFIYKKSNGDGDKSTPLTFGEGVEHDIVCAVTADGAVRILVDGEQKILTDRLEQDTSDYSMYIFGANTGNSSIGWPCTVKLHGFRIWQDGTLVRDFRPCVDTYGKAALYDMLNRQYYYPKIGTLTASDTEVPVTAVWKGGAVASVADFTNAANWECFDIDGKTLAGLVPTEQTTVVLAGAADPLLSLPSGVTVPKWGDVKLTNSVTLSAATDWSGLGRMTLGDGVTVDLNGNSLSIAQFVADDDANVTIANSGASVAVISVMGSGITSLERITLVDKVKLINAGSGSVEAKSETFIGRSRSGKSAEVEVVNGEFSIASAIRVGYDALGKFAIGNGAKVFVKDASVGHNNGGDGTLTLADGELRMTGDLWLGVYGTSVGRFVQNGGIAILGKLRMAGRDDSSSAARGSFVQTGGILQANEIMHGYGVLEMTLNGGTLKAQQENAVFFNNLDNVILDAGGVTIDTAYDIGASNTTITVCNGGKIVKTGAGGLDLSGISVKIDASMSSDFIFASLAEGENVGGFSGLPSVPRGWKAKMSIDGRVCRISKFGFMILVR